MKKLKYYVKGLLTFNYKNRPAGSPTLLRIMLLAILAFTLSDAAQAARLIFSYTDPVGDHTGIVDVTNMTVVFDNATGDYEIFFKADAANPFVNQFRVNVNLYNPDTTPSNSRFQDAVNDYNLAVAATQLTLTGTNLNLLNWNAGQRVATSTQAGLGNPPNTLFFRTGVGDLPLTSPPQEDNVAFDTTGISLIRAFTSQDAAELLIWDVETLSDGGSLTGEQADGLIDKLEAAIRSLDRGNTRPACNQLRAFVNKVSGLVKSGMLPPNEGQELIDAAQEIRNQIGC